MNSEHNFEVTCEAISDSWGTSCQTFGHYFVFSGDYDHARARGEKLEHVLRVICEVVATCAFLAGVGVMFGVFITHQDSFIPFISRSWANIAGYIGVLCGCYAWAIYEDKRFESQSFITTLLTNKGPQAASHKLVDVYDYYSGPSKTAWTRAIETSHARNASALLLSEVLNSLLRDPEVRLTLSRLRVSVDELLNNQMLLGDVSGETQSRIVKELPFVAMGQAARFRMSAITPSLLLASMVKSLDERGSLRKLLYTYNVQLEQLFATAVWSGNGATLASFMENFRRLAKYKSDSGVNRSFTSVPTPYLDQFSEDITLMVKYNHVWPNFGRQADCEKVLDLLRTSQGVLVLGKPGSGRKTLMYEIAYAMCTEEVPERMQDKRLISLRIADMIGDGSRSEQVLVEALSEAVKAGNVVLAIEDFTVLIQTQTSQNISLAVVLVDFVRSHGLQVIALSTLSDHKNYIEKLSLVDQVFHVYELSDMSHEEIVLSVVSKCSEIEGRYGVIFLYEAIEKAIAYSDKFFKDLGQPGRSVSLLEEAARGLQGSETKLVTADTIATVVSTRTHVDVSTVSASETSKLANLEAELRKQVIGQETAVSSVVRAMKRSRAGLTSGSRPIASFLFVGPTGVGKTELARALSKSYLSSENYMLRLDMSEYRGEGAIEKLLGSPHDRSYTAFVNHLKSYPFCLLLLDELEKASPEVWNLFLQALEDGRLTTGAGEVLDLTNTIVIATSNAGSKEIQSAIKEGLLPEQVSQVLMSEILPKYFAPEIINRFDAVVAFSPLSKIEAAQVVRLMLHASEKKLEEQHGITLECTESASELIATESYDPVYGARPIRRYIQDHVESLLADFILQSTPERGSTLVLDAHAQDLILTKK